jgi:2-polyprenyl-3-methyl-5-hydroxy-6-metoxy-1,4-benzoquinol methylase
MNMVKVQELKCGVCYSIGLTEFLPIQGAKRDGVTTLARCRTCGTLADARSLDALTKAGAQFREMQAGAVTEVYATSLQGQELSQQLEERRELAAFLADLVPQNERGSCFDFGCGSGLLACALTAGFSKVYAYDLQTSLAAAVAQKLGKRIDFRPLFECADASINLLTAWHVPEHLDQPHSFFLEASRVLAPGGVLACQSPAPIPAYVENDHVWFFTLESWEWVRRRFRFSSVEWLFDGTNQFLTAILRK